MVGKTPTWSPSSNSVFHFSVINYVARDHRPERAQEPWNVNLRRTTGGGRIGLGNNLIPSILWLSLSRETNFLLAQQPNSLAQKYESLQSRLRSFSYMLSRAICVSCYKLLVLEGISTPLQQPLVSPPKTQKLIILLLHKSINLIIS
jgi:hypothetical protein